LSEEAPAIPKAKMKGWLCRGVRRWAADLIMPLIRRFNGIPMREAQQQIERPQMQRCSRCYIIIRLIRESSSSLTALRN
jgi:hypothetical protein